MKTNYIFKLKVAYFAVLALALSACGEQEYKVTASTAEQKAPGSYSIQPKVDILLVEDDTGSMSEVFSQVSNQIPQLLNGLEDKKWDYHFATIPLTTRRNISQVLAAKYDINWASQWVAPFPGATPSEEGMVTASFFRTPSQYTNFLTISDINSSLNGFEPGFENIKQTLFNETNSILIYPPRPQSGFIRSDALLVVFVIGNGEDTSGVTFCTRSDGITAPCEDIGRPGGTKESSFQSYKSFFTSVKPDPSQLKFYAAVAPSQYSNCLGGGSYAGLRYMRMATETGGQNYNICSTPLSSVLGGLSQHLQSQKLAMQTRYLFVAQEPDPASIKVVKYTGGDMGQSSEIPEDGSNGWTYAGHVENVHAIDSPVPMNLTSGWAIELHGSAKLVGDDTAAVEFKPAGAQDSGE